jgi:glycosyltransferase involved in cell wall biosynthesis
VLHVNNDLFLLIHSLRCFIPQDYFYEVIVVTADKSCASIPSEYPEVKVVWETTTLGVYAAMNLGVAESKGDFIYFSGQDDHILSGFAKLLKKCIEYNLDYCAAAVLWGDDRVVYSTKHKNLLWFKNWCHQAVIYRRTLFEHNHFNEHYLIQADHDINLFVRYNPQYRFEITRNVIAWYSGAGISSRNKDFTFWASVPQLATSYCNRFDRSMIISLHFLISTYSKIRSKVK